jgi:hypothetical protein
VVVPLLGLSLAANAVCAGAAVVLVRRRGGLRALLRRRDGGPPFLRADAGTVVLAGDSHVEHAPLLDLLTPYRQCGVAGQTVDEVAAWLPAVVGPDVRAVVLAAGTNDVLRGATAEQVAARCARLLDRLPPVPVVLLGIPRLDGHERAAEEADAALRRLCVARGLAFLPLTTGGGGDGIHLTRADYRALAPALLAAVEGLPER